MTRTRPDTPDTVLQQRAAEIAEDPDLLDNPAYLQAVSMEFLNASGGNMGAAFPALIKKTLASLAGRKRVEEAMEKIQRAVREQPTLMRVVSPPFPFSANGNGEMCQGIYVTPFGSRQLAQVQVLALSDGLETPDLLSPILTDAEGKVYLGPAPLAPMQLMAEQTVSGVEEQSDLPGMVEVIVKDEMNQTTLLYATQDMAKQIAVLMNDGEEVVARHDHLKVHSVKGRGAPENESFVEYLPLDGPTLADFIFSPSIATSFTQDTADLTAGIPLMVLLVGPTGVGKTSGVYATLRTAAQAARKDAVAILVAPHTVGSMWHSETEKQIARAFQVARKIVADGNHLVGIVIDEIDALVSSADARHESSVDHRVRLTIQQVLSQPLPPFVSVYATMNTHRGNLLHGPVAARFLLREYPRPARRQMARLGAMFVEEQIAGMLDLSRDEFGQRSSDFLFSDQFVLARLHLYSGESLLVRARDLHRACPRVLKMLVEAFSSMVRRGASRSIEDFFIMLEKDFHAVHFTEHSLLDNSYLQIPANDSIRQIQRL